MKQDDKALPEAALSYAARGLYVFPLHWITAAGTCSCGNPECEKNSGKHPLTPHGLKDATTDPEIIKEWWARWPTANIGIRTGAVSGFFVLDIDGPEGEDFLKNKQLPTTPTAKTGRGRHIAFKHPGGHVRNAVKIAPGVDLRGDEGYIVADPSKHRNGTRYSWLPGLSLEDTPLADAPAWLLDLLQQKSKIPTTRQGVRAANAIPDGSRNATLASLAGTMRRRDMQANEIYAALKVVNHRCEIPLPEGEVQKIAMGMMRYPAAELLPAEHAEDCLALEFTSRHAEDWRYVAAWGKWFRWDGSCWQEEETLRAFDLARQVCRETAARDTNTNRAARVASAATVAAVERLAKADRKHAAIVDQWDSYPWLLNTPGGVVNLETGRLKLHERGDYLTKIATATPQGDCPAWRKFLGEVTGGDEDLQAYLARIVGYSLTGTTHEHALFFLYGTGGNGKSVFLNTLKDVLGDYATTAPADTFLESINAQHPTDLAGLRGARIVTASEVDQGRRWAEAKIKSLTGGDLIAARFMRQDFFKYRPQFKLFIAGNHKPTIRSVDEAIKRRFHLVPFKIKFGNPDKTLSDRLLAERDGILAWAVQGCLEWQLLGSLRPPATVTGATQDYFTQEDALGRWLDEACVREPSATATTAELYAAWEMSGKNAGEYVASQKHFSQELESRGFNKWRDPQTRRMGFRGIKLA